MTKIASRLTRGLCVAIGLAACAAQAQPAYIPERRLEILWQVELRPEPGQQIERDTARLRAQDDGRVSFGLVLRDDADHRQSDNGARLLLVTVDGDGRIVGRVPVEGPGGRNHTVVALQGGDFLVHVEDGESTPGMTLRRIGADGAVRGTWRQAIDPQPHSLLLDAVPGAHGMVVAIVSIGPGPNDTLAAIVLGPDGRPLSDHRTHILLPGHDIYSRLYLRTRDAEVLSFDVIASGSVRPPAFAAGHFAMSFSMAGSVAIAELPVDLGPELMICNAMTRGGRMVRGLTVPDNDGHALLRWYGPPAASDWKQALESQRQVPRASRCEIALREDGSGGIWLEPRLLLSFGADNELVWRATLGADAIGVAWLPDGDIVVLRVADTGLRLVRYTPR